MRTRKDNEVTCDRCYRKLKIPKEFWGEDAETKILYAVSEKWTFGGVNTQLLCPSCSKIEETLTIRIRTADSFVVSHLAELFLHNRIIILDKLKKEYEVVDINERSKTTPDYFLTIKRKELK